MKKGVSGQNNLIGKTWIEPEDFENHAKNLKTGGANILC